MESDKVFHSKPDTLGGTPVFVDTRVPVKALFDYLGAWAWCGPLSLTTFPSVTRERAEQAIVLARDSLLSKVVETAAR